MQKKKKMKKKKKKKKKKKNQKNKSNLLKMISVRGGAHGRVPRLGPSPSPSVSVPAVGCRLRLRFCRPAKSLGKKEKENIGFCLSKLPFFDDRKNCYTQWRNLNFL